MKYYHVVYHCKRLFTEGIGNCAIETEEFIPIVIIQEIEKMMKARSVVILNWIEISKDVYNTYNNGNKAH